MIEKRSFSMHPNLLFDVIMRQAGTLQKALLEGVMNAIDAGATRCDITLKTDSFSVEDNGRGIQSRKEIEEFFETFGTPHTEGDAIYGRFRMGRGQMMAFGRNIWRSRQFEMDVDVKNTGLDYDLTEHTDVLKGTRITAELYDPIAPSDMERIKSEMRQFVAWAQIPIYLNGEKISKEPGEGKWTFEDEDAYYALSNERTQLSVYNLGVLVNTFHAGRVGIGGTIVTKKQVQVNFARNDIQSSCAVFKRIQNHIKKETGTAAKKKTKLTDAERDMLVNEFLSGTMTVDEASKLRVITCVHGRSWPLKKLLQIKTGFGGNLFVAKRGDQLAETAQHRAIAFAIDEATLERFGVSTAEEFVKRVVEAATLTLENNVKNYSSGYSDVYQISKNLEQNIKIVQRDYLLEFVDEDRVTLLSKELSADQKIMLTALNSAMSTMVFTLNQIKYEDLEFSYRKIHLGKSQTALAWTDGVNSIWFDTEHARLLRNGYRGAYQIAGTLLHEMLHTGPDTGTHQHDYDFYKSYHDLEGHPMDPVGRTADRIVSAFTALLRQNGKKISAKLLARDDYDHHLETTHNAVVETETV
jgi:hypothetical protein